MLRDPSDLHRWVVVAGALWALAALGAAWIEDFAERRGPALLLVVAMTVTGSVILDGVWLWYRGKRAWLSISPAGIATNDQPVPIVWSEVSSFASRRGFIEFQSIDPRTGQRRGTAIYPHAFVEWPSAASAIGWYKQELRIPGDLRAGR